jgi:type I restriction enzyme R subunit
LKRRGVAIREALNQIRRYQRDSFLAASGLFEYIQIFVISNGTRTKCYSNTTRNQHIKEDGGDGRKSHKKTSNSFEFTSYWADGIIRLLNILTRYCMFTAEDLLLVSAHTQIVNAINDDNVLPFLRQHRKNGKQSAG